MAAFFDKIVHMSLAASLVILLVLPVRRGLRRAPKAFSYLLWAAVLFRLLCPVAVPVSVPVPDLAGPPAAQTAAGGAGTAQVPQFSQTGASETAPLQDRPAVQPAASAKPAWTLRDCLPWLYLAGAAGTALWGLTAYLRLRFRLIGAEKAGPDLYLADHLPTPCVLGAFRPKIYLPSDTSPAETAYLLAHERAHIRWGDPAARLLFFGALCLHWFNPLVWLAFCLSARDMEMRCDEAVIRALGLEIRANYAESLLARAVGRPFAPLAFGQGDPKERIENMANWKKPTFWRSLAAGVLCAVFLAACGLDPQVTHSSTGNAGTDQLSPNVTDPPAATDGPQFSADGTYRGGRLVAQLAVYNYLPQDGRDLQFTLEGRQVFVTVLGDDRAATGPSQVFSRSREELADELEETGYSPTDVEMSMLDMIPDYPSLDMEIWEYDLEGSDFRLYWFRGSLTWVQAGGRIYDVESGATAPAEQTIVPAAAMSAIQVPGELFTHSVQYITSPAELPEELLGEGLDEAYFSRNAVALVRLTTPVSSGMLALRNVTRQGEVVTVSVAYPALGDTAIANWLFWIEVPLGLENCDWRLETAPSAWLETTE